MYAWMDVCVCLCVGRDKWTFCFSSCGILFYNVSITVFVDKRGMNKKHQNGH